MLRTRRKQQALGKRDSAVHGVDEDVPEENRGLRVAARRDGRKV